MTEATNTRRGADELRRKRSFGLSDQEIMLDAQNSCVPCKLCGGRAAITDAGPGAGYYVYCQNSRTFRSHLGCMISERRLSGSAYNVMDWWNLYHTPKDSAVEALEEAAQEAERIGYACAEDSHCPKTSRAVGKHIARTIRGLATTPQTSDVSGPTTDESLPHKWQHEAGAVFFCLNCGKRDHAPDNKPRALGCVQRSDGTGPGSWVPAEQLVQANERIAELEGALALASTRLSIAADKIERGVGRGNSRAGHAIEVRNWSGEALRAKGGAA